MKSFKITLASICLFAVVTGCSKEETPQDPCESFNGCALVAPETEVQQVRNYLIQQRISDTVRHCSGVYYVILESGTGKNPNACSMINVNYTGRLTNGTVFDQGTFPQPYKLYSLIRGWISTIPLIKQGGRMRLIIPPTLGYGQVTRGPIPANSVLDFEVELTFVN
jgi:FKBP-type peptidyl-prolyl cis-trans isomerase FkpA